MKQDVDWRRLLALARPEASLIVVATVALFASSGVSLLLPQGIRYLMDAVTQASSGVSLDRLIWLVVGIFLVSAVFTFLRAFLFTLAGERIVRRLRKRLFHNVIQQEIGFFDAQRTGEILNRLSADTQLLQSAVTVNVSMALRFLLQAVGSVAILIYTSWQLSVLMLAVVPVVAIGGVLFGRSVRKLSRKTQDALARATEVAEESIANVRTVRSFAREEQESGRYAARIDEAFQLGRRAASLYGVFQGTTAFFGYVSLTIVLWYGGKMVLAGSMSLGTLTAFMLYTLFLGISLGTLSGLFGDFNKALGASVRVFELLDRLPGVVNGAGKKPPAAGVVRYEQVSFAYPTRADAVVLAEVSLTLEPGKVVALVGPSGSGKSTVAQLLARFYDPASGRVLLDGVDLRELDTRWLREQIGSVQQEPVLFATSIADNIRYGRLEATQADIEMAARAANAHDFVTAFPEGYLTLVGERGVRLSGGQKQRIAIARALLKNPAILVLDEATSALDSESEHLVQQALERLMLGRATLVIAHRLSTVKDADQVIVLEQGRVVETGRHDELVQRAGVYKRLVEHQFAVLDGEAI